MTQIYSFNPPQAAIVNDSRASLQSPAVMQNRASIILIAEDESVFRTHIQSLLEKALKTPLKIIQTCTGGDAVDSSLASNPHLVIMDLSLPGYDGLAAARRIWSEHPQTKILFWAHQFREIYARDLLKVAPDQTMYGFILKTNSDEDLVYAVCSLLLHHNSYIHPDLRKALRACQTGGSLTDVELETLHQLALGLTDKAMAMRSNLSLRGIQSRVNSLYRKLLLRNSTLLQKNRAGEMVNLRTHLVFEAIRRGLIAPEQMSAVQKECFEWIGKTLADDSTPH